ncbi:MAG: SRPBCC domain-containing protein [Acidobacteria bacterium]|nr:SRPBCC domain-containing protein [Acidobacteriota bacterium]
MSVKKDLSGRRYVEAQAEIPGMPEQVWDAIATGPGVSSWFVPTEKNEDGTVVSHFGPGMDAVARETAWDPPRRFAAEGEGFGPGCPPLATEWIVEAKDGEHCIVRVVHSLFTDKDDWDNQLEQIESGWPDYFRILYLYRQHFSGQYAQLHQFLEITPKPAAEFWDKLALPIPATVQQGSSSGHPNQQIFLTNDPPGLAHLFAMKCGPQTMVSLRLYQFGGEPIDETEWRQWLHTRV